MRDSERKSVCERERKRVKKRVRESEREGEREEVRESERGREQERVRGTKGLMTGLIDSSCSFSRHESSVSKISTKYHCDMQVFPSSS